MPLRYTLVVLYAKVEEPRKLVNDCCFYTGGGGGGGKHVQVHVCCVCGTACAKFWCDAYKISSGCLQDQFWMLM